MFAADKFRKTSHKSRLTQCLFSRAYSLPRNPDIVYTRTWPIMSYRAFHTLPQTTYPIIVSPVSLMVMRQRHRQTDTDVSIPLVVFAALDCRCELQSGHNAATLIDLHERCFPWNLSADLRAVPRLSGAASTAESHPVRTYRANSDLSDAVSPKVAPIFHPVSVVPPDRSSE